MSQSGTGDIGGTGIPSAKQPQNAHPSHFYHQWPDEYNYGYNYYPVKPTNPHMASAMRANFPMQMGYMNQMHPQYFNGAGTSNGVQQNQAAQCNYSQFFHQSNYGKPQMQNAVYSQMQNAQYFQYQQQQSFYPTNNCSSPNQALISPNTYQNHHNGMQQSNFAFGPNSQMGSAIKHDANTADQVVPKDPALLKVNSECLNNSASSLPKTVSPLKLCDGSSGNAMSLGQAKALPRCDSTKSEAAESSCSSISTESSSESANPQNQVNPYARTLPGQYVHNQNIQMQHAAQTDSDSNNNMNYRSYMNSQQQNVIAKSTNVYCDQQSMQMVSNQNPADFKVRGQVPIPVQQYQQMQSHVPQGNTQRTMIAMGGFHQQQNLMQCYPNQAPHQVSIVRQPNYAMVQQQTENMQPIGNIRMPFPQQNIVRPAFAMPSQPVQVPTPQTSQPPAQPTSPQVRPKNLNSVSKILPPPTVVPYGWKRINNNGQVEYISPSGVHLKSQSDVVEYISQDGTCKCGLHCPLRVEQTFCFDPKVPHRATVVSEIASDDIKLCNHRRKLALSFTHNLQNQVKKEDGRKKRKRKTPIKEPEPVPAATMYAQPSPVGQPVAQENVLQQSIQPIQQAHQQQVAQQSQLPVPHHPQSMTKQFVPHQHQAIPQQQQTISQQQHVMPQQQHVIPQQQQVNSQQQQNIPQQPMQQQQTKMQAMPQQQQMIHQQHQPPMLHQQQQLITQQQPMASHQHQPVPHVPQQHNWPMQNSENQKTYGYQNQGYTSMKPHQMDPQAFIQQSQQYYGQQGQYANPSCSYTPQQGSHVAQQNFQNYQNGVQQGYAYNNFQGNQPSSQDFKTPLVQQDPVIIPEKTKRKRPPARPRKKQKTESLPEPDLAGAIEPQPMSGPSFMEDPNGYMAQQTALLNNTMSGGGVGQFSPQGKSIPEQNQKPIDVPSSGGSLPSSAIVPLPSNVPLPARVSKSVSPDAKAPSPVQCTEPADSAVTTSSGLPCANVATMESSSGSHIVTVTYTNSSPSSSKSEDTGKSDVKPNSKTDEKSKKSRSKSVYSNFDADSANKPLMPGSFTNSSQSPLEMVQNIVSSIPVPTSPKESLSRPGSIPSHQIPVSHGTLAANPQTVVGAPMFNVAPNSNIPGVMYNTTGVLRGGTSSLVVHGPPGNNQILSSSSGNVVVVTSPFTSKVPTSGVPCSTVSSVQSVVGVPQVQVQPAPVQHSLQQIQQVQPMVQLVNAFTAMQTPVIIQNGSNIIQQHSNVISNPSGVIGHSIIPSSGTTFVSGQPILPAPGIIDPAQGSQQIQVAKISPASSESHDDSASNRLTPIGSGSNRSTPQGTPNSMRSDTPTSGGSSGGGRKRKRRNPSTPQPSHIPQNIMPAIIMGKQLSQPLVVNSQQVPPYNTIAGTQVSVDSHGQMVPSTNQRPINVVQMVSGPMPGAVPVHLQQAPTILVPSANPSGILINQLPDGTFVSTDPNTGMSYPVQLQLSGSHIVGVTPTNSNSGVIGTFTASSNTPGTMVAVGALRSPSSHSTSSKVINITPQSNSNVYTVPLNQHEQQQHMSQQTSTDFTQAASTSDPSQYRTGTVLQQKTTIVAQQTTLVSTQKKFSGTHSSVSTQTPVVLGESDVTSSDSAGGDPVVSRVASTSPSHQSAEITTTKQDEEALSSPEVPHASPLMNGKSKVHRKNQLPPTTTLQDECLRKGSIVWGIHQGQHNWPALLLDQAGGEVVIRWFGDQVVEQLKKSSLLSQPSMATPKTRRRVRGLTALENALQELRQYSLSSKNVDSSSSQTSPPSDAEDESVQTDQEVSQKKKRLKTRN